MRWYYLLNFIARKSNNVKWLSKSQTLLEALQVTYHFDDYTSWSTFVQYLQFLSLKLIYVYALSHYQYIVVHWIVWLVEANKSRSRPYTSRIYVEKSSIILTGSGKGTVWNTYIVGGVMKKTRKRFAVHFHVGNCFIHSQHLHGIEQHRQNSIVGDQCIDCQCILKVHIREKKINWIWFRSTYARCHRKLKVVVRFSFNRV